MKRKIDRRRNKRYIARDGVFAVLRSKPTQLSQIQNLSMGEIAVKVFKNKPNILGKILDFSEGGLSFTYIPGDEQLNETYEMDILFADDRFYIYRIPYNTVLDVEIDNAPPYGSMPLRKKSVQFGKLHLNQKTKLQYFKKNLTKREA